MPQESIWTVLITTITILGSTSAWRFYEKRALRKEKDEDFVRLDCRDRISKLEALLQESGKEKDSMRETILKLSESVAQLVIKVEFLSKENNELHENLQGLPKKVIKRQI
jgi:hypothetical protein